MKVLIVCSGNVPNFNFEINQAFIYDQVTSILKNHSEIKFEYFFIRGKSIKGYLNNRKKLVHVLKNSNIDIIHAHFALSGLLAVLQRLVPVVTTFHGTDINNLKLRLISMIVEILSNKTIYVSHRLRETAIYTSKKKSFVIPCGVDMCFFQILDQTKIKQQLALNSSKKHILFSSAFDNKIKNFPLLKKALQFVLNFDAEVHELKNYTRKQVMLLMNAVDLCAMTSFSEGSPQFIKEAMACNCPIVSTDVGDVREIIRDTEGCYISSFDPKDVAAKIKLALDFNKRTNGREKIRYLDNRLIAEKIVKIYNMALKSLKC